MQTFEIGHHFGKGRHSRTPSSLIMMSVGLCALYLTSLTTMKGAWDRAQGPTHSAHSVEYASGVHTMLT